MLLYNSFSARQTPWIPIRLYSMKFDRAACVILQSARSKLEPPHYDGVQSLALKGNYLFSGSRDNSIKKWNIQTQQLIQVKWSEK